MKKIKITFILISLITLMLSINSCQEYPVPTYTSNISFDEFTPAELPVTDDFIGDLKGLDLNSDFYIVYPDENISNSKTEQIQCGHEDNDEGEDDEDDDGESDHHREGCKNGINPLGKILNKLGLTKEQRKQIYEFRHDYHDCLKEAKRQIRIKEKAIIDEANQQKSEIRKRYKNGEITKQEADALLNQLQEQIRNKLNKCVQDEIKDCVCEYLNNILSVLDESQAQTFIDFITTEHPEFSSCFGDTPPPPPPGDVL